MRVPRQLARRDARGSLLHAADMPAAISVGVGTSSQRHDSASVEPERVDFSVLMS
jgi:hypothetical protein